MKRVFSLEGNEIFVDFDGAPDPYGRLSASNPLPTGGENMIARAFAYLYQKRDVPLPVGVHITCTNRIPTSSGLGSQCCGGAAGVAGCQYLSG